ncbi:hypothetical protein Hanom_Chr09g00858601 [Helianthus anomalus]
MKSNTFSLIHSQPLFILFRCECFISPYLFLSLTSHLHLTILSLSRTPSTPPYYLYLSHTFHHQSPL